MKDDRLRTPVEPTYTSALGLAAYVFATLEWDAVWCCERIAPNSINNLVERTAGQIATKLIELVTALPTSSGQTELYAASIEFKGLVNVRNALLHAKPGTDADGGQRLFRDGQPWTIGKIEEAADDFSTCSIRLNALLYGFLDLSRT